MRDGVDLLILMEAIAPLRSKPTAPCAIARSPLAHRWPRDPGGRGRVTHDLRSAQMRDRFLAGYREAMGR
jgi:hypothetical protein